MSILDVCLLIGIFATLAFTALRYIRSTCSLRVKTLLIFLRVGASVLIPLALYEPTIMVHRLHNPEAPLPILLDVSASMSLFPITDMLEGINALAPAGHRAKPAYALYLFGDSLRPTATAPTTCSDHRSYFPHLNSLQQLAQAPEILVISDANWSNREPLPRELTAKTIWYTELTPSKSHPSLIVNAPDSITTWAQSPCTLTVSITGNHPPAETILLTIKDQNRTLQIDSMPIPAGSFSFSHTVTLPPAQAGLHCYALTVASNADSLSCTRTILHRALPNRFGYTVVARYPSLNTRFLRLALSRFPSFVATKDAPSQKTDCRFIFDPSGTPANDTPTGITSVYLGLLPGTAKNQPTPSSQIIANANNPLSATLANHLQQLPPIETIVTSRELTNIHPYLSCVFTHDTLPFLFSATFANDRLFALATPDFWRNDFLPLAHDAGESDVFILSDYLLNMLKNHLMAQATDTLLIYIPQQQQEYDSVSLSVVLPNQASIGDLVHLACTVRKEDDTVCYDSIHTVIATESLLHRISMPPHPHGVYQVVGTTTIQQKTYTSSFTFSILTDRSEYLVTEQNRNLLQEIGRPLRLDDTAALSQLLAHDMNTLPMESVAEPFTLRRTWPLLLAILSFLLIEWALRRKFAIE